MALREKIEMLGNWIFRWRSYLPLLILPILLIALRDSQHSKQIAEDLESNFFEGFFMAISFAGLAVRCITVGYVPEGTSGRTTRGQEAKMLNTTGMYSIIRHPLYFGNFVIFLGITLFVEVWWFTMICILVFFLYYGLIMFAEEEFLKRKFGNSYLEWAKKTPAFLPKFWNWQQPSLPFSFKTVLKREYTGFFVIISSFVLLETIGEIFTEGKLQLDLEWSVLFMIGLIVYLTLRTLKKRTKILDVEGR